VGSQEAETFARAAVEVASDARAETLGEMAFFTGQNADDERSRINSRIAMP
jgi:hypothetical protein